MLILLLFLSAYIAEIDVVGGVLGSGAGKNRWWYDGILYMPFGDSGEVALEHQFFPSQDYDFLINSTPPQINNKYIILSFLSKTTHP